MCSFDISGATGLTNIQYIEYVTAWKTFNRIQYYDSNVSTLIHTGASGLQYYTYKNYAEKLQFIQGQSEHMKAYPYYSTLWYNVQKNYK